MESNPNKSEDAHARDELTHTATFAPLLDLRIGRRPDRRTSLSYDITLLPLL